MSSTDTTLRDNRMREHARLSGTPRSVRHAARISGFIVALSAALLSCTVVRPIKGASNTPVTDTDTSDAQHDTSVATDSSPLPALDSVTSTDDATLSDSDASAPADTPRPPSDEGPAPSPEDINEPTPEDTTTAQPDALEPTDTVTAEPDIAAAVDTTTTEPDTPTQTDTTTAEPDTPEPVCEPNCSGKTCGDDGCGGSCGDCPSDGGCGSYTGCVEGDCAWEPGPCDDGDLCTVDVCDITDGCITTGVTPGPCSWPGQWTLSVQNPVLTPVASSEHQGLDNIYAPDVLWHNDKWWMWYGGQGSDGHDGIFLARSDDLLSWQNHGGTAPIPVVDHGAANHVNDPSVVRVGDTFFMYYTEAPTLENDQIHLATSSDGINWAKQGMVLEAGAADSWEPDRVGRPSVLHEEGEFRMWYDGQVFPVARHVGYATSPDGFTWTKHPDNPVVEHEGAVDVDRLGDWYVMLAEAGDGTSLYVAKDPVNWQHVGKVFGLSGQAYDAHGQVTPFLLTEGGTAKAILYGGASDPCWCMNRIAIAFPDEESCIPSCDGSGCGDDGCGGSCGECADGSSCQSGACIEGSGDCSGCLGTFATCDAACQQLGSPSGYCATPGSTDPGACCSCDEDTGCEGCLIGYDSCMGACQATGSSGGYCGTPGSQNPDACCTCF